jgi:23S rRNA (uracil1939-C5)-methyltransferase
VEKIFSGTVKDLSSQGLGVVVHPSGMTYFVTGAWPGDAGEFEITAQEKRFGFAKWHKQVDHSEDRTNVPCPHLGFEPGLCGGCPWMGIKYDKQLAYKQKNLSTLFNKNQIQMDLSDLQPSTRELGFRNRAQLKTDGQSVGYISPKTKTLAPIEDCVVLNDPTRDLLRFVRAQLPKKEWLPQGKFSWNFIDLDDELTIEDIEINKKRPFKQANSETNAYMKRWLEEQIKDIEPTTPVLELFCGSGNFTEVLGKKFFKITASEFAGNALENLKNKNIPSVTVFPADLFDHQSWKKLIRKTRDTKFLFLDPPREGFKDLSLFVGELPELEKIVYVACDPHRFVIDVKPLLSSGWSLKKVQPVDQFPHTPHVELMAVLTKEL